MFVESVERRIAYCAWFDAGELRRAAYGMAWLVEGATVLA